ncbi:hypothetical protein OJF2_02270 [Aquisphaera giovannonii]|uniref:DUF4351 domain-containing protein n=1 Tax=Aquisphaera giovannonii TaxID=406548 RepID=A0A5B9VTX4_9BACT|nr:hypothetical protein [Aquisphaera giovannonii]QEH31762.1 hypothetical protein OJF2_02270 [Aquisphaera giovannonii]
MAKPFDATTKDLFQADPAALLVYLGLRPAGPVEVLDADLSTVTTEADMVYRVGGPDPYLVHVEMQSSSDATLPRRLLRYNALLDYRHGARVWSVAVLLRPEADGPGMTGSLGLRLPDGRPVHDFRFGVVRTWQQSAETILRGPLSLLPLALLADAPPEAARSVIHRIDERLARESSGPEAARLMNSTFLLAGLRFAEETIATLFFGTLNMSLLDSKILKDSSSYRLLERLIRIDESRALLLALATRRFGPPTGSQKADLDGIDDHDRLQGLCLSLDSVSGWDELLAGQKQG